MNTTFLKCIFQYFKHIDKSAGCYWIPWAILTTYLSSNFQLEYTWSSQRPLTNETKHWQIYSFPCLCRYFFKKIELTFAVLNSSRKRCHAFYLWATLFFNLSSVLLNFFVNRLSNVALLRCCLIHVRTIILRHIFIYYMSVHA